MHRLHAFTFFVPFQVLSSVRQKVDSYAVTTRNFSSLIPKARLKLKMREDSLLFPSISAPTDYLPGNASKTRAATITEMPAGGLRVWFDSLLTDCLNDCLNQATCHFICVFFSLNDYFFCNCFFFSNLCFQRRRKCR
jgi:hypothetical protein